MGEISGSFLSHGKKKRPGFVKEKFPVEPVGGYNKGKFKCAGFYWEIKNFWGRKKAGGTGGDTFIYDLCWYEGSPGKIPRGIIIILCERGGNTD